MLMATSLPEARKIIHLGATSCYVTDNTDLILIRDGLTLVRDGLVGAIDALGTFARTYRRICPASAIPTSSPRSS